MRDYPESITPADHIEPAPRRVRAVLNGAVVFDTTAALYVWEWPKYPQYYVPFDDVDRELLVDEDKQERLHRGSAKRYGLRVGDVERKGVAHLYAGDRVPELANTVRFDWAALDAWFEEDEQVFVHARDPYTRLDAIRSTRSVRVESDGVVLAESLSPVMVFETGLPTRYYLDRTEVHFEHLEASDTVSSCPYKGQTTGYWSIAGGERDIAWSYDFPAGQLQAIAGLIAFYNEKVDIFLDGQPLERPHTTSRSSQRKDDMTTPIADEVARMHADAKSRNESENPFTREQAMLAAAGAPAGIASVGSTLPDAQLLDPFGNATTLSEALDGKAAVLVLYRGAWCPYCNLTLSTYKDQLFPQLLDQDVTVIAISPQAPDGSLTMQEKHELPFPVLSDPGNVLVRALGVLTQPSEETLAAQRQYGIELTEINADGTVELPMPTVVVVDSAATVRWIDVQPDYSVRTEPDEILAAVAEVLR